MSGHRNNFNLHFLKVLVLSSLFFGSFSAYSKVYVISDIDDTIKKANSADRGFGQAYHFLRKKVYPEMRDLFNELDTWYQNNSEEVEFHYLSAAPDFLFDQEKWLTKFEFPLGPTRLRRWGDGNTYDYKTAEVARILEKALPSDTIYFFGDNASKDAIVYKEAVEKFGFINSFIYIRDVTTYATYLHPDLKVERLEGVNYFFSERELLLERGLFFISDKLTKEIRVNLEKRELIPEYTFKTLVKRIQEEWGCFHPESCDSIAFEVAEDIWIDYHDGII